METALTARDERRAIQNDTRKQEQELDSEVRELREINAELAAQFEVLKARAAEYESGYLEAEAVEEHAGLANPNPEIPHPTVDPTLIAMQARIETLQSKLQDHARLNGELRKRNEALKDTLETLKSRIETLKERLAKTNIIAQTAREKRDLFIARNQELQGRIVAARTRELERREKLVTSLAITRERLVTKNALWDNARKYFALFRQGLFYDEIEKSDVDLRADTYLCLLPSTVPAALALQRKYGGRVICDCVENVEVNKQSLAPNLHPPTLEMVNLGAYGSLTRVDGIMSVSRAVVETLERFGPPVRLQPNYRWYEEVSPSGSLRERCNIASNATVLVTTGNIVKGFEAVLDAIAQLPRSVHLVAFVKVSPSAYEERVRQHIDDLGIRDRVHLQGFVPYEELAGLLADADAGLITLDPSNPNHSVSLPNRVFDFTTAGLPFVAPPLREISAYITEYNCGVTIPDVDAASWIDGISEVLSNIESFRESMERARKSATWNSQEDGLVEFLGHPRSVTMLGFRDLSRYQRFLRTTDSLTKRGIQVKAAFFSEDPLPLKNSDAEFYHFTDRYGTGPGLLRVPNECT